MKVDLETRVRSGSRMISTVLFGTAGAVLGIYAQGLDSGGDYSNFKKWLAGIALVSAATLVRPHTYRNLSSRVKNAFIANSVFNAVAMMGSYVGFYFF